MKLFLLMLFDHSNFLPASSDNKTNVDDNDVNLPTSLRSAPLEVAPVRACKHGPLDVMLKCEASHWPEFLAIVAFMTPSCDVGDRHRRKKSRRDESCVDVGVGTDKTSMCRSDSSCRHLPWQV